MNVSLTPELERLVNRKVKSGEYQTASEVVREGLRLLKERDQQAWLRAEIQKAIDEADRGEGVDYDENSTKDLVREITERGKQRLAAMRRTRNR